MQAPNPRGFMEMELFRLFDHILNPPLAPVGKDAAVGVAFKLSVPTDGCFHPPPRLTNPDPTPNPPPNTGGSKSSKNRRSSSHASSSSRERDRNRNRNHSSAGGGGGGGGSATKKMPPPPVPVPPPTALPRLAADASVASLGGESAVSQMTEASYAAGGGEGGGVKPPPRLRKASSRLVATIDERGPERLSGAFWGVCVGWMDRGREGGGDVERLLYMIRQPVLNHPLPQQPPHINPGVMLRCYELNKRLLNHPAGLYFREPVDPVRHECENYFDVIKVGVYACVWREV